MSLASGHSVHPLEGEEWERLQKDHTGYEQGLIRLQPGGWILFASYPKFADNYYNFKFRSGDVVVMTYPKCGTTWMQEIVWTMCNNPDLTNPAALQALFLRTPFLEMDMMFPEDADMKTLFGPSLVDDFNKACPTKDIQDGLMLQLSAGMLGPRIIKTHLPFSLLPPNLIDTCKVVYVGRNPKDLCMSYLHHHRLVKLLNFVGTLDTFVDNFINGELLYGHYWKHLQEAWTHKDHPNMHLVFFEDMKKDIKGQLGKLSNFLGTELSQKQIENVAEYTSFASMKSRDPFDINTELPIWNVDVARKDGTFFRKGEVGSWKQKLTPEQEEKIEQWTKAGTAGMEGLEIKYQ